MTLEEYLDAIWSVFLEVGCSTVVRGPVLALYGCRKSVIISSSATYWKDFSENSGSFFNQFSHTFDQQNYLAVLSSQNYHFA